MDTIHTAKEIPKHLLKSGSAAVLETVARTANIVYPERNRDPLIISGSPRGGTTWIAESVARIFDTPRVNWEPLQEGNPEKHRYGFSKRPVIDAQDVTKEAEAFFERLLAGLMMNKHTLRLQKQPAYLFGFYRNRRLIIKFVRGNGVVGYLHSTFGLPKPLVVIRHPCAVVASQLNMKGTKTSRQAWEDHPYVDKKIFNEQPELASVIDREAELHRRLAMTWAADVLNARRSGEDVQIRYYEDVVVNKGRALKDVLKTWGLEIEVGKIDGYLDEPSSSHKAWTQLDSEEAKLSRWKKELSAKQASEVIETVRRMGVEDYSEEPLPKNLQYRRR